jgi:hypothetical protein
MKDNELEANSVIKDYLTTAADDKSYVDAYIVDVMGLWIS